MVTFSSCLQKPNVILPVSVTLPGMFTLVRLWQKENAVSPIFVTPSGIVTLVRLKLPENAFLPISTTFAPSISDGMFTSVLSPMYVVITTPLSFFSYSNSLAGVSGFVSLLDCGLLELLDCTEDDEELISAVEELLISAEELLELLSLFPLHPVRLVARTAEITIADRILFVIILFFLSKIKKCAAEATHRKMQSSDCCDTIFRQQLRYTKKEHALLPYRKSVYFSH